ncbi:MAG TPA: UDP-N-acetylmuramoyl-tripeptide--D-alanyl-D-alanine ligase [Steroidobacteraceae bacterium]|jgi:UDP-N-acetylmuramoyl-tripeptide--D-alanyl-D-alanine ligase|nr:UDP-N-acetylmuramoyl-tripeptide--D-alanyl-D-alanine ligase [Steroidobacteraceae bacterium]
MRTLASFAEACGGRLQGADRGYSGVGTDTRTLGRDELFVALRGPRFNGNEFVAAAHAAGAAGAVVDAPQVTPLAQVIVAQSQAALARAAQRWRAGFDIPVIAVAGSNGKTSTKEMTAAILQRAGACLATRGNLNNHIGVPLTLLRLERAHRFAVIEMGANQPGDVAALVALAAPSIGLITNAGAEHLQGFGTLEGAARAEGEVVEGLPAAGTAVINADDPYAPLWRGLTRAAVVTFGVTADATWRAQGVRCDVDAQGFKTRFTLAGPLGRAPVMLELAGRHNVMNALAAAAAAVAAGARLEHVVAGLAAVRAVPGRLQFKRAVNGAWLIDDSYNANPSSVRAAIEVLAQLDGRKWLVLGDMAELGDFAQASHAEIGAFARAQGIERLFATGVLAVGAVESFGAGGEWFPDTQALAAALAARADGGVRMLVKGSRMNRLERVVEALTQARVRSREK